MKVLKINEFNDISLMRDRKRLAITFWYTPIDYFNKYQRNDVGFKTKEFEWIYENMSFTRKFYASDFKDAMESFFYRKAGQNLVIHDLPDSYLPDDYDDRNISFVITDENKNSLVFSTESRIPHRIVCPNPFSNYDNGQGVFGQIFGFYLDSSKDISNDDDKE